MPTTIPFSIDWLPNGQLLVVAAGSSGCCAGVGRIVVDHADLSDLPGGLNEIVVDGRGTIWVNGGSDFYPDEGVAPGFIAAIGPDGVVRQVADGIAFPNGMAVTEDNSTLIIAESFAGKLTAFEITDTVTSLTGGLSQMCWPTGSAWMPRARYGRPVGWRTSRVVCGWRTAVRYLIGFRLINPVSPAPSAVRTVGRFSC